MNLNRNKATQFVENILTEATAAGLDLSGLTVDHICYRTTSGEEYDKLKGVIQSGVGSMLRGDVLSEVTIGGRLVSTFRLHEPIACQDVLVEALELAAPKKGAPYESGFQHIEVVITEPFDVFVKKFANVSWDTSKSKKLLNAEIRTNLPSGAIKFHHLPLSCIIALEERSDVHKILMDTNLLEVLQPWTPMISGSLPLEVGLESSDLDILLYAKSIGGADFEISKAAVDFGPILWEQSTCRQGDCLVGSVSSGGLKIQFFVSETPVLQQHSHLHLLAEYKLLVKHGPGLRRKVIHHKSEGRSTEEAFALSLKIPGDPYEALLCV